MRYPLFRRRRLIDLTRSLRRAHSTGVQTGCDTASETIDTLLEQMRADREAMHLQIQRLREQFRLDLAAVCDELRATKAEIVRLQQINQFATTEHRDLSQSVH
jgi:DNA-directed RNA polymerase specialized sigma24 family protein